MSATSARRCTTGCSRKGAGSIPAAAGRYRSGALAREYADAIRADLRWLGLTWDGEARQSARFALYEERFAALRAAGRIYPAYETAQELDLRRKVLLGRGLPPVYDRAALSLTPDQIAAYEAEGRTPHWRFRLEHGQPIVWTDLIRGSSGSTRPCCPIR